MAKSIYGVHPGVAMVQTAIAKLPEKTGRSLDEWIALIRKSGPKGETARRDWLKKTHRLGTNYAGWLAERAEGKGSESATRTAISQPAERYVEEMFAGSKAALRPMYDGAAEARALDRHGREGVPVQDDRAALSQPRVRADQADDAHAHRSRPGAGQHQGARRG